jgi:hypothetical protein
VNLATYPAVVVLAARATAGLSRKPPGGSTTRALHVAGAVVLLLGVWTGVRAWLAWFT